MGSHPQGLVVTQREGLPVSSDSIRFPPDLFVKVTKTLPDTRVQITQGMCDESNDYVYESIFGTRHRVRTYTLTEACVLVVADRGKSDRSGELARWIEAALRDKLQRARSASKRLHGKNKKPNHTATVNVLAIESAFRDAGLEVDVVKAKEPNP